MGVRKAQKWSNLAVLRGPDPFGPRKQGSRGVCLCAFLGVPFRVPWRPFGTPDGKFLGTLEAVLGHAEAVRAPPLHEKCTC